MSKNNKVYTIYQTKNLINGMIYIGCHYTNNIHDRYLGSGKYLKKAIKEYGRKNFKKTIICITKDWEVARKLERLYVDEEFIKRNDTYNVELGGIYKSEETRRKMSEAHKNISEETRKKLSESCKGRIISEETKRKMSEAHKNISEETRKRHSEYMKQNHPMKGKHHSEETKRKISEAHKGRIISEETRKKMSEAHKNYIKYKFNINK